MMRGMHGMYGYGYGSIWMIVFWVVLIGLGIYLLRKYTRSGNKSVRDKTSTNNKNTPLQTLQERLAKGEIDEAEYEHLKTIIKRDKE